MACECERSAQSQHAGPGPIANDESLIRLVHFNECIRDDGSLEPARFNKSDFDRKDPAKPSERGFSTNREKHLDGDALKAKAVHHQGRAADPQSRREIWAYTADVAALRNLEIANDRSVCVVDRAEADDASHAELWGSKRRPGSELRMIRDQVLGQLRKSHKVLG